MASPLKYFRKHQKAFLVVAAVVAMFVFVFADMFLSMSSNSSDSSSNQLVTQWDHGKITVGDMQFLRQRRVFLSQVSQNLYGIGRARIESEGGTAPEPTVPVFALPEQTTGQQLALQVVDDRVIASLAKEAGMVVSNKAINKYLYELGLGRVTDQEIELVLSRVRGEKNLASSKDMLFSGLRELLLGNLYNSSLGVSADGVAPTTLWDGWLSLNKRIKLEAAVLPAKEFVSEVAEPTDVELVGFYEENKNRYADGSLQQAGRQFPNPQPGFRQRKKVRLKYLVGDLSAWTEKMLEMVTEEEIVDFYEQNKETMFLKYDPIFDDLEGENADMLDEIFVEEENDSEDSEAEVETEDSEDASAEETGAEDNAESVDGTEEPADDETGSISSSSPFRLAALQAEVEESSAGGNASTTESPSETPESDNDGEESSTTDAGDADEQSKYEPLENVREEIRRTLASDKAVEKLTSAMESCYGQLTRVYDRYGRELAASQDEEGAEPPAVPEALTDLSDLAKEHDLYYEETEPRSVQELFETPVGKARHSQNQTDFVYQIAFGTLGLYEPVMATDAEGYQYLVLKVEEIPEQTPPFKDIRDEVVNRWKLAEAKKLALEKGAEIAKKAEEEELDIPEALGEDEYEIVVTDFFSKFDFGTAPNRRPTARLGEAPPLTNLGVDFMNQVFEMNDDDVLYLANYDGEEVYVFKIAQKERTEEELQQAFLKSFGTSREVAFIYQNQLGQKIQALRGQVFAQARYNRQALVTALQQNASRQQ